MDELLEGVLPLGVLLLENELLVGVVVEDELLLFEVLEITGGFTLDEFGLLVTLPLLLDEFPFVFEEFLLALLEPTEVLDELLLLEVAEEFLEFTELLLYVLL